MRWSARVSSNAIRTPITGARCLRALLAKGRRVLAACEEDGGRVRSLDARGIRGRGPRSVPAHGQGVCPQSRRGLPPPALSAARARGSSGGMGTGGARALGNLNHVPAAGALASETAELACEIVGLTKSFGAVKAVDDVSLEIGVGSLTCLIGPNGAGKSTLLGCISGFHLVDRGLVRVGGRDVTRWPPHRRARHGLATVFQTTRPLAQLDSSTTPPSARMCAHAPVSSRAWCDRPGSGVSNGWVRQEAQEALEIVGLGDHASTPAAVLPLGQLRLLAIARALAQRPDPPAARRASGRAARRREGPADRGDADALSGAG